jgi:hypothetical protein
MVALVVTECVLQYSLALSNLLQRPSIDLVEAASEAETVISSLRGRATDSILIVASILLVYQQAHCLCSVAYQLSSVCSVIHSAFRQVLLCPGITPARHCHPVKALNIFKSAHALIIDTLDVLGTGGDRNAMQLKLALQDFGFMGEASFEGMRY